MSLFGDIIIAGVNGIEFFPLFYENKKYKVWKCLISPSTDHYFTFNQIYQENNKKTVVINFSKCKYPMDLHSEIKEKLELPEWYGNNLDALGKR